MGRCITLNSELNVCINKLWSCWVKASVCTQLLLILDSTRVTLSSIAYSVGLQLGTWMSLMNQRIFTPLVSLHIHNFTTNILYVNKPSNWSGGICKNNSLFSRNIRYQVKMKQENRVFWTSACSIPYARKLHSFLQMEVKFYSSFWCFPERESCYIKESRLWCLFFEWSHMTKIAKCWIFTWKP